MHIHAKYMKTFMESSYIGDHHLCDAISLALSKDERLQTQKIYDAINEAFEEGY